jgi:hypothetical protein
VVPPGSHRVSRVRRYSGTPRQAARIRVRGPNPVSPAFPGRSASARLCDCTMRGPTTPAALAQPPVWPLPRSLATTRGISVDFSSSGYLDVSVPQVAAAAPMCSARGAGGWPPAGSPIRRSAARSGYVPLTAAYRSLSRPSSASCAKASTVCPYHLLFRWLEHTSSPPLRLAPPRRLDAIFLKKIDFSHAMQLSRYGEGEPSRPDAARLPARRRKAGGGRAPPATVVFSLERR